MTTTISKNDFVTYLIAIAAVWPGMEMTNEN